MCKALAIHDNTLPHGSSNWVGLDLRPFLLDRYLGVELLYCLVIVCSTFVNVGVTFYILTGTDETVNCSASSPKLGLLQFSSVQLCPTLCDPMNRSMPGLPVHHQLPEFTQTHIHRVSDAIQPSHPVSSPSPLAPNPSQHQSLFQWVSYSHEVAKVLEFQL